jgi:hypothetical protein
MSTISDDHARINLVGGMFGLFDHGVDVALPA